MRITTTPTNHHLTRRFRSAVVAGAIGLLACGSLAACGASSPATKATGTTTSTAATNPTTTANAKGTTVVPNNTGNNGSQGNGGSSGGNTTPGGGSGGSTSTTEPKITGFTTPETFDCAPGGSENFTLSWTTKNATKVTISIDGPGIWDTYEPNGSASVPFSCGGTHTYLLTVFGTDGTTVTKQVTIEPRNLPVPDPGADSDS